MIRIIRGNVTDSKLAAVPDRTNGSLSLSLNRGPSFFSLHFFSFFFHSMRELFSFIFFHVAWEREGEKSEFRNGCISRSLTMRELIYRARANPVFDAVVFSSSFLLFSFLSSFFCVCTHCSAKGRERGEELGACDAFFAVKSAQRLPKIFVFKMIGSFMSNLGTRDRIVGFGMVLFQDVIVRTKPYIVENF